MRRRTGLLKLLAVGGAIFLAACASALAGPRRVVSTDLCSDEYVFRLVPRAHIAALSWLAGDRSPVVSTIADEVRNIELIHPSTEEVLARRPDLVVMFEGSNPRLRAHLAEAGIAIVDVDYADSIAGVRAVTRQLGKELGNPLDAEALLGEMDRALAQARAQAPNRPVSALFYEPNGYATGGTLVNEIMAAAGLVNADAALHPTRAGTVPVEELVATAPDLLILNGSAGGARSGAELVLRHPAVKALEGRTMVVSMAMTPLLCAGPWSARLAPTLGALGRAALVRKRSGT